MPALIFAFLLAGCAEKIPPRVRHTPTKAPMESLEPRPIKGKKILLVHSYHREYAWVAAITEGVEFSLNGTGVELEVFYMDTKRKTDEAWKIHAGELACKKVEEYKPDVIIAADDNAQQYFAVKYIDKSIPIVFTGVDADPSKYGYPASNITGVIERSHFIESIAFAGTLRPIKRIAVLSCDDETSRGTFSFMKQEPVDVEVVEWKLAKNFDDWKRAVKQYNKTVDAIVIRSYQALKNKGYGRVDPKEVATWTIQNAAVPTIAFHDFDIKDGILLGVVKSGMEYGRKPAEYALEILRGTPINSLPIIKADIGQKMINKTTADRLGIKLTDGMYEDCQVVSGD